MSPLDRLVSSSSRGPHRRPNRPQPPCRAAKPPQVTVIMRNHYETLAPIVLHTMPPRAPEPLAPLDLPPLRTKPAMVSISCQSGESFMPLARVPSRWEQALSKILAITDALGQLLARITPRVTLAVGIYPSIPDRWPAIFQRQR